MKKRIIALAASLAVIFGLAASQSSYAWFVTAIKKAQNITIAVVSFDSMAASLDTLEEDFYGRPCIYPGQNLVLFDGNSAALTMYNNSTINTQIRVKIEYTSYKNGHPETVVYTGSEDDDLQVDFASPDSWVGYTLGMDGCCFYYLGPDNQIKTLQNLDSLYSVTPDISSLPIIESVKYKESIDTSLYSGNPVEVNITFEAKQADYVGWSSLGTYSASTQVD